MLKYWCYLKLLSISCSSDRVPNKIQKSSTQQGINEARNSKDDSGFEHVKTSEPILANMLEKTPIEIELEQALEVRHIFTVSIFFKHFP